MIEREPTFRSCDVLYLLWLESLSSHFPIAVTQTADADRLVFRLRMPAQTENQSFAGPDCDHVALKAGLRSPTRLSNIEHCNRGETVTQSADRRRLIR